MKTILTIFATLITAFLVFYFLIYPTLCKNPLEPINTIRSYTPPTQILFKGFSETDTIYYIHSNATSQILSGKLFPKDDSYFHFDVSGDKKLEYKLAESTPIDKYNMLAWTAGSKIKLNLNSIEITQGSKTDDLCFGPAERTGKFLLTSSVENYLRANHNCIGDLRVCKAGTNECKKIEQDGSFSITFNVDQSTCTTHSLVFRCGDNLFLGSLTLDDPDDVEIRVVLGGILDKDFLESLAPYEPE